MALPSLAQVSELSAWVGRDIPSADPRAGAVLSHASSRVRAYTRQEFTDSTKIPDPVRDVVVRMAARVYLNPEGLDSITLDDGTKRWGANRGLSFTDEDREDLAAYVAPGAPAGLGVVSTYRGDLYGADTIYVPTAPEPSGQPFPWLSDDEL